MARTTLKATPVRPSSSADYAETIARLYEEEETDRPRFCETKRGA